MKNKHKIVDVVFYEGEENLLLHRVHNFYSNVHLFIIVESNKKEFSQSTEFTFRKENFAQWIDKIIYLPIQIKDEIIPEDFLKEKIKKIISQLNLLDLLFEDILIFSKTSEFPDFSKIDLVKENLYYEPAILRQTELVYNTKYKKTTKHLGSCCFFYSQIIQKPSLVKQIIDLKKKYVSDRFFIIDGGINHNFFAEDSNIKVTNFLEEYPFDKKYLIDVEKTILEPKAKLVVINFFENKIPDLEYETILNFNFTKNYSVPEKTIVDNTTNINIFIPTSRIYDIESELDFDTIYSFNEVAKTLRSYEFLENQKLIFVSFRDQIDTQNIKETLWKDVKNLRLDEYLKDFVQLN